jgi:hypothetical protein
MNRRIFRKQTAWLALAILLVSLLPLALTPTAQAQNYSFSVPQMDMQAFVQPDSTVRIEYDITFRNAQGAHPIDIVDIGTPHDDYDISNMSAAVDGVPVNDIRVSEYIDTGVEIHLGSQQIAPGSEGTLQVEFTMPDLVYGDTTRNDYASLQITPTWFDSDLVNGTTNLRIAVHLPSTVQPDEALFQDVPFDNKALFNDRTVVAWEEPDWRATGPYRVGVSFPDRGMTGVIRLNAFQLAIKWVEDNTVVRMVLTGAFLVLFGFLFFRFSGNTGWALFFILGAGFVFLTFLSAGILLLAFIPLIPLLGVNEFYLRKRRGSYLPPIAQVEGGGIKRGLTAPEAAVILEQPVNKVLMLVIFGMLKKGILKQTQAEPLMVEVASEFRTSDKKTAKERADQRIKAAQQRGVVLHPYEHPFLDTIESKPRIPINNIDFSQPMKELITHAASRVKGFDLSDTQDYYRSIIRRAVQEAEEIGDIEQREQKLDRNLEWLLMGDNYGDLFEPRGSRYRYRPMWIRPPIFIGGGFGGGGGGGGAPSGGDPSVGGSTTFGDVAASFAGWTENTMGNLADTISPGSLQAETAAGGFVDLSGVDRVTSDFFEAMAEASAKGGSGGGGGCACAGCACACACAGGGR